MCLGRLSALVFGIIGIALCQQGNAPGPRSSAPRLDYKVVEWPLQSRTAAGTPAGPWNFIQVASVAATARGNILVLHRGAHPIMEFESGSLLGLNRVAPNNSPFVLRVKQRHSSLWMVH